MTTVQPFLLSWVINAPRALVFLAHTDVAHVMRWMSPAGFTVIHAEMDLRPGDSYHYWIRGPDGAEMWGKQTLAKLAADARTMQ